MAMTPYPRPYRVACWFTVEAVSPEKAADLAIDKMRSCVTKDQLHMNIYHEGQQAHSTRREDEPVVATFRDGRIRFITSANNLNDRLCGMRLYHNSWEEWLRKQAPLGKSS